MDTHEAGIDKLVCGANVGEKAPEFIAEAYYNGEKVEINFNDFKGSWIVLLFYKSDFTFV